MRLVENGQIVPVIVPADLATAQSGDWVSLENFGHATVVFLKGVGTAGEDPTLTVLQAQDASGTGSKALNFTKIYKKNGATALNAVANFTEVANTDNTYGAADDAASAENQVLWALEIDANELDADNGFDHFTVNIGDTGTNTQLGTVIAVLTEARYPDAVAKAQSGIA